MNIEIRHARVVVALAETGSISKASARLALPQPSVSAQLRRIEKAVGGPLFVRSRLGVEPTSLGDRLVPMMVELLAHADAIVSRIDAETAEAALRIGIVEWTPVGLQQSIVAALLGVVVRTETLESQQAALAAVRRGQLDAALVSSGGADLLSGDDAAELSSVTVFSEPVWVALPRGADRGALRSLSWVRRVREHRFHDVEEDVFRGALGFEPEAMHRVAGHAEAMTWVRDAGVAALATATAASPDIDLVELAGDGPCDDLTLVWRRGALDGQPVRKLVRSVRAYYAEYAKGFPRYWSWLTANPQAVPALAEVLPLDR